MAGTNFAECNRAPALHMKRRHFLLAILAVASSARAANEEVRRFRVAFANLNEELATSIVGLGFSGVEIRRSFELASRSLPLDMMYYDNGGDAEKALVNAADAVSRKVDLLIEYNSDTAANAEIGRQLKTAGIPVLAINHAIPGAPLYTADRRAHSGSDGGVAARTAQCSADTIGQRRPFRSRRGCPRQVPRHSNQAQSACRDTR